MKYRLEIRTKEGFDDPKARAVERQIRSFLELPLRGVQVREVYALELNESEQVARTILEAFTNPVTQIGTLGESRPENRFTGW